MRWLMNLGISFMKLKICGMKYADNLAEVAALAPDYLGFIFYEKSPRYMVDTLPPEAVWSLPAAIHRVGVFVNASIEHMQQMAERYGLNVLQLHGQEPPEQCQTLKAAGYTVIKVFSIGQHNFDFDTLRPYEPYVDFFLFNTLGKQPGGNGLAFDWQQLKSYPLDAPYFLSGGIGLNQASVVQQMNLPHLHVLDVNSSFETEPGRKDPKRLAAFVQQL